MQSESFFPLVSINAPATIDPHTGVQTTNALYRTSQWQMNLMTLPWMDKEDKPVVEKIDNPGACSRAFDQKIGYLSILLNPIPRLSHLLIMKDQASS